MSDLSARAPSFTEKFVTLPDRKTYRLVERERPAFLTTLLSGDEFAIIAHPLAPPLIVHFDGERLIAAEIDPVPRPT